MTKLSDETSTLTLKALKPKNPNIVTIFDMPAKHKEQLHPQLDTKRDVLLYSDATEDPLRWRRVSSMEAGTIHFYNVDTREVQPPLCPGTFKGHADLETPSGWFRVTSATGEFLLVNKKIRRAIERRLDLENVPTAEAANERLELLVWVRNKEMALWRHILEQKTEEEEASKAATDKSDDEDYLEVPEEGPFEKVFASGVHSGKAVTSFKKSGSSASGVSDCSTVDSLS